MYRTRFVTVLVILAVLVLVGRPVTAALERLGLSANVAQSRNKNRRVRRVGWSSCLPDSVKKLDNVASDSAATDTVRATLDRLRARCEGKRLIDQEGREIRFVHLLCWGNPPADADEQTAAQQHEIADLRKRFTVILLRCDPRTE
jgi:hypothetical protein